ncbi:MAG: aspartate kinase [Thermoproteota archaeon]
MSRRVIIKFGGAALSTGENVKKAAEMVKDSGYQEIAIVVSAMGKTTDNLVKYLSELEKIDAQDYSQVVSMGERISARMFSTALKSMGVKSTYFDPEQERWPVITDSNFRRANPEVQETKKRVKRHVEKLLGECVPVICGFLGKDHEGHITTLGRGGSDTTATLLGNCLQADEIILVKDTEGILSADPDAVPNAQPLPKLSVEEMFSLAYGGARIIHPKALKYKPPRCKLRAVNFSSGHLSRGGTELTGVFNSNSIEINTHRGLTSLTVIGDINSKNLSKLFLKLGNGKIFGVCTGRESVTVFAKIENPKEIVRRLHDLNCFKAVSSQKNVGIIELMNPDFIDSPGWMAEISSALAQKGINILEVTTSKSTINLFIDGQTLDEAFKVLREK